MDNKEIKWEILKDCIITVFMAILLGVSITLTIENHNNFLLLITSIVATIIFSIYFSIQMKLFISYIKMIELNAESEILKELIIEKTKLETSNDGDLKTDEQ